LTKKGVLLEIIDEDIKPPYRGVQVISITYNNILTTYIQFMIVPVQNISGQWNVIAKFMGVQAITTRLVLQDLLQKQYEGINFVVLGTVSFQSYINLSYTVSRLNPMIKRIKDGKAKVNVNLLLHLLNKKFHTSNSK